MEDFQTEYSYATSDEAGHLIHAWGELRSKPESHTFVAQHLAVKPLAMDAKANAVMTIFSTKKNGSIIVKASRSGGIIGLVLARSSRRGGWEFWKNEPLPHIRGYHNDMTLGAVIKEETTRYVMKRFPKHKYLCKIRQLEYDIFVYVDWCGLRHIRHNCRGEHVPSRDWEGADDTS